MSARFAAPGQLLDTDLLEAGDGPPLHHQQEASRRRRLRLEAERLDAGLLEAGDKLPLHLQDAGHRRRLRLEAEKINTDLLEAGDGPPLHHQQDQQEASRRRHLRLEAEDPDLLEAGDEPYEFLLEVGDEPAATATVNHGVAGWFSAPVHRAHQDTSYDEDDEAEAEEPQGSPVGSPRKRRKMAAKTRPMSFR